MAASSHSSNVEQMAEEGLEMLGISDPFDIYSVSAVLSLPSAPPPQRFLPLQDRPLPPPPSVISADTELLETWQFVNQLFHELDDASSFEVHLKNKIRRRIAAPLLISLYFLMISAGKRLQQNELAGTRDRDNERVISGCEDRFNLVSIHSAIPFVTDSSAVGSQESLHPADALLCAQIHQVEDLDLCQQSSHHRISNDEEIRGRGIQALSTRVTG